jgi:hypothetical protein
MSKTSTIKLPDVYAKGFDPTSPNAPGAGDGLPYVNHTIFHIIELAGDDHLAGALLFHFMFLCRRSQILIGKKRWYVRSRADLCHQVRMTRHQYDRALKELKLLGFVETRRLPFSPASLHLADRHAPERSRRHAMGGTRRRRVDDPGGAVQDQHRFRIAPFARRTRSARCDDPAKVTLNRWTIHDLRRTARSAMTQAGISPDHAERALGHVIGGVRGVYDRHDYFDEKRRAFEALAGYVGHVLNRQPNVVSIRRASNTNGGACSH